MLGTNTEQSALCRARSQPVEAETSRMINETRLITLGIYGRDFSIPKDMAKNMRSCPIFLRDILPPDICQKQIDDLVRPHLSTEGVLDEDIFSQLPDDEKHLFFKAALMLVIHKIATNSLAHRVKKNDTKVDNQMSAGSIKKCECKKNW